MTLQGLALAWFRREDWPRWCAMDPDFQRDFDRWHGRMEAAYAGYLAAGMNVIKVVLDPAEFLTWSQANGAGVDSGARATYASLRLMEMDERERRH